jgi:hypothetical protein
MSKKIVKGGDTLLQKVGTFEVHNVAYGQFTIFRGERVICRNVDTVDLAIKIAALLYAAEVS